MLPNLRTEPAAIIGLVAAFVNGGLLALGDAGTLPPDIAAAAAVLITGLAGLAIRGRVYSPASADAIADAARKP